MKGRDHNTLINVFFTIQVTAWFLSLSNYVFNLIVEMIELGYGFF